MSEEAACEEAGSSAHLDESQQFIKKRMLRLAWPQESSCRAVTRSDVLHQYDAWQQLIALNATLRGIAAPSTMIAGQHILSVMHQRMQKGLENADAAGGAAAGVDVRTGDGVGGDNEALLVRLPQVVGIAEEPMAAASPAPVWRRTHASRATTKAAKSTRKRLRAFVEPQTLADRFPPTYGYKAAKSMRKEGRKHGYVFSQQANARWTVRNLRKWLRGQSVTLLRQDDAWLWMHAPSLAVEAVSDILGVVVDGTV